MDGMVLGIDNLRLVLGTRALLVLADNVRVCHPGEGRVKPQVRGLLLHIEEVVFCVHGLGNAHRLAESRGVLLLELTVLTVPNKALVQLSLQI